MSRIYAIKYHTGTGVVLSLLYFDYVMLVILIQEEYKTLVFLIM